MQNIGIIGTRHMKIYISIAALSTGIPPGGGSGDPAGSKFQYSRYKSDLYLLIIFRYWTGEKPADIIRNIET